MSTDTVYTHEYVPYIRNRFKYNTYTLGGRYVAALPPDLCFSSVFLHPLFLRSRGSDRNHENAHHFLAPILPLLASLCAPRNLCHTFLLLFLKTALTLRPAKPEHVTTFVRVCNEASSSGLALLWFVLKDQLQWPRSFDPRFGPGLSRLDTLRTERSHGGVISYWSGSGGLFSLLLPGVSFYLLLRYVERQCAICVALLWFQPLEAAIFSSEVICWSFVEFGMFSLVLWCEWQLLVVRTMSWECVVKNAYPPFTGHLVSC